MIQIRGQNRLTISRINSNNKDEHKDAVEPGRSTGYPYLNANNKPDPNNPQSLSKSAILYYDNSNSEDKKMAPSAG